MDKKLDYTLDALDNFKVIGLYKDIKNNEGYEKCPKFWDEFLEKYTLEETSEEFKNTVKENCIGEFGISINNLGEKGMFRYMIAGTLKGKNIPEGFKVLNIDKSMWVKFKAIGPLPKALQDLNTRIWNEWVPLHPEYELSMPLNIEWYSSANTTSKDYECGIWLPIKVK